jgi:hypothetical protein
MVESFISVECNFSLVKYIKMKLHSSVMEEATKCMANCQKSNILTGQKPGTRGSIRMVAGCAGPLPTGYDDDFVSIQSTGHPFCYRDLGSEVQNLGGTLETV